MNKFTLILVIVIGFLSVSIKAQETVWLDKDLIKTTTKNAVYFKVGNNLKGEVSYFYKNKSIYRKVFYADGKLNGKFSEYYKTGELKETGTYSNGFRTGNWKVFYKTGKIKKKGRYNKGNKVGIWKVFYKND